MNRLNTKILGALASTLLLLNCQKAPLADPPVTLYAMDCGGMDFDDMASFSSDGRFDRQSYTLAVPCFLIRHPSGDLLWDLGLNQAQFGQPGGITFQGIRSYINVSLVDQLASLGLKPSDIEYVAVSHSHPDHIGNADLFRDSTFIVSADEHAFMFSDSARQSGDYFKAYAHLEDADTIQYDTEHDVFGDGAIRLIQLPGHTPGSAILVLQLDHAGPIMFTGDLITHSAGRDAQAIPIFNLDADQTRASLEAFEALAAATQARVIIQHEPKDFAALPAFPNGLD